MAAKRASMLVWLGAAVLLAPAVRLPAETQQTWQAERAALVEGLQAQFEVALIRERKLADDRETRQIAVLEARLQAARTQADAAQGDAKSANAALAEARTQYANLAAQLSQRDESASSEIASYHAEAQTEAQAASPELVAALQRFADGDRVGAWPQIAALAAQTDAAPGATDASRAASAVRLAGLRDIMRAHGEAPTADVLALYDKAAQLDPTQFSAHIARAKLAKDAGDLSRMRAAAEQAKAVATSDGQRAVALRFIADAAVAQHDNATAAADLDAAAAIFQRNLATDPTDRVRANLAAVLQDKGDLQVATGDFSGAKASYQSSLALRQQLATAHPDDAAAQDYQTNVLQRIGDLDLKLGDEAGARSAWTQGLAIRQKLAQSDPANTDHQFSSAGMLRRMADLSFRDGDVATAKSDYEQLLVIHQRLAQANPSSARIEDALATDRFKLAALAFQSGDTADAIAGFKASLAIRQKLEAADPTDAERKHPILLTMTRLARIKGSGVSWSDVAAQYAANKQAGALAPEDAQTLTALKDHGLMAGQ